MAGKLDASPPRLYTRSVLEEYAKLNDLMGTITVASGLSAKVADLSLTD